METLIRIKKEKLQLVGAVERRILISGLIADLFNIHGFGYYRTGDKFYEKGGIYVLWHILRKCKICGMEIWYCRPWGVGKDWRTNKCLFCCIEDLKVKETLRLNHNKELVKQGLPEIASYTT